MAEAEARVHRTGADNLHLHELGTLDTLVDVVGSVAGLEALGVERFFSSPFPMGAGVFRSAHGVLPVPVARDLCAVHYGGRSAGSGAGKSDVDRRDGNADGRGDNYHSG